MSAERRGSREAALSLVFLYVFTAAVKVNVLNQPQQPSTSGPEDVVEVSKIFMLVELVDKTGQEPKDLQSWIFKVL